jgi:hypothetical protein
MAERTPVVKKYRDALETVIGATMEFLSHIPPPSTQNHDPSLPLQSHTNNHIAGTPQQQHRDLPGNFTDFSPTFAGAAQESYVRGSPKTSGVMPNMGGEQFDPNAGFLEGENEVFGYMPQTQTSPGAEGRWEGRHGEMGQMDAEWLLSLCEGDGFSLQMLNEMMRFEPSLGA